MTESTINWQPADLEDDLLTLAPLSESSFDELFEAASDPLIWEQHPSKDRYKKEIFQGYFNGAIESGTAFLIRDKVSGKLLGCTRYYDYKPGKSIAIGFTFLTRASWGGPFNRSSKTLLLNYAFQFVDEVYFHIGPGNLRSQLATKKLGAVWVGEVKMDNNGQKQPHYEYVIKKEDWKEKNPV